MNVQLRSPAPDAGLPDCSTAASALEIEQLELIAGDFALAVRGLRVAQGSRTAIIGGNGTGKTTLIEAVLGLRASRRIEGRILGAPLAALPQQRRLRRRLGVQLQHGLYPGQLSTPELMALHRAMFGRGDPAIAMALGLDTLGRRAFRDLSGGQRQRLNLYMALGHAPELAILDEPFTGLDRRFADGLADVIRNRGPLTVLFICHGATELALADTLVWLHEGAVRFHGPVPDALERFCGRYRVELVLPDAATAGRVCAAAAALPATRRADQLGATGVRVFGDAPAKDFLHATVTELGLETFAFAASSLDDLLRFCVQGGSHG